LGIYKNICVCVCVCVHAQAHAHTHTHNICTHTHTQEDIQAMKATENLFQFTLFVTTATSSALTADFL